MVPDRETNGKPLDDRAVTPAPASNGSSDNVTIRRSAPGDGSALSRLARLDDRRLPAGPHVVAERDGEIVAAAPLAGGTTIANPFMYTADVVTLIELRARQLPT
jgi:hypothetical protein